MYNKPKCPKQRPKPRPKERPRCPLDCLEEERRERYERLKACAPAGFQAVLEKIIRHVMLARPIHLNLFIADLLDAEISRRTFDDVVYGCQLKKSLKRQPYPTESCMIIKNWLMCQGRQDVDDKQFRRGPIPQYELAEPALDRYREYAGIGEFDMSQYEEPKTDEEKKKVEESDDEAVAFTPVTCIPEREMTQPALDRYRDYAGIGPFDPDDVADECWDHMRLGYAVPNCKCTFCTLKAEKSRPSTCGRYEDKKDPCARPPVVQTLYIEQPVYREPAYEKERLFKEKGIKGYEPFGAIFQKDEHYKDGGLQPPDPFKEHPIDRDILADSPQESPPDDPGEKPVPASAQTSKKFSEYTCETETPEIDPCEGLESESPKTPVKAESAVTHETAEPTAAVPAEEPAQEVVEELAPAAAEEQTPEATEEQAPAAAEEQAPEAAEEQATAAAEEQVPEAAEEQTPEAAEQENVEEAQATVAEEPPAAEPEAAEEVTEENPGAATEEQPPEKAASEAEAEA